MLVKKLSYCVVLSFTLSAPTLWASCAVTGSLSPEAISKRLSPPGVATITRSDGNSSTESAAVILSPGAKIYKSSCTACHSIGVAGAPKKGDTAAWDLRLQKGIDTLLKHVKEGFNAMPAGGACPQCSDEDYKNAIDFMHKGQ